MTLAEQLRQHGVVWEGEDEGAGGGTPDPKPETSPAEPKVETPPAEPKVEAKPEAKAEAEPPKTKDWKDNRIARLTAQLRQAQTAPQQQPPEKPLSPTEDFDKRVSDAAARQAAALVAISTFNEKCNAVALAGQAEYGEKEFNESLEQMPGSRRTTTSSWRVRSRLVPGRRFSMTWGATRSRRPRSWP